MSKYKTIKGVQYSKELLVLAEKSAGPERKKKISLPTAKKIIKAFKADNIWTVVEQRTLSYILSNFEFTDNAYSHFYSEYTVVMSYASSNSSSSSSTSDKTPRSASSQTDSKTNTQPAKQFTEFVNEETGETFSTILEWGNSLPKSWGGIQNYLDEYPGCKYLTEVLDLGTTVDSMQDYKRGYECNRYMYRGYDGKIYGFYVTEYVMEYTESTDFEEFEIREVKTYAAGPKGRSGSTYRPYSSTIK